MGDPLSDQLFDLSLKDEEPPVLRSAPADIDAWTVPEPDRMTMRCVAVMNTNLEEDVSISVEVVPHRCEKTESGGTEQLVCSLRPFTVHAKLLGSNGVPVTTADEIVLCASLAYADNFEPVLATKGETPLCGELDFKQLVDGEAELRLRATALSYHHGRRAFVIRVDAKPLSPFVTSVRPCFGYSSPIFSRARLPDQGARPPPTSHIIPSNACPPRAETVRLAMNSYDQRVALPIVDRAGEDAFAGDQCASLYSSSLISTLQEQNETLRTALAEQRQLLSELAMLQGGSGGGAPAVATPSQQLCV